MSDRSKKKPIISAPLTQLIGVKDLAKLLGISIITCRRWENNGNLPPSIRLGATNHRRWNLAEVQSHLAARRVSVDEVIAHFAAKGGK